jgi:hypothetical protein
LVPGDGSIWVITRDWPSGPAGSLVRVDPVTGKAYPPIPLELDPWRLTYGFGSVWVVGWDEGQRGATVIRVDAATGTVTARINDPRFATLLAGPVSLRSAPQVLVTGGSSAYILGDYMGLTAQGESFVALLALPNPRTGDMADIFFVRPR